LLLIRAPADEAAAGLAFTQFVSQLNVRVYLILSRRHEVIRDALERWTKRRGLLIGALISGVVGYFALISVMIALEAPVIMTLAAVLVAAAVFVLLPALTLMGRTNEAAAPVEMASYLLLFAVICALSVLLLPFGRQIALASVFLDVTAEATPPGEWTVHLLVDEPVPGKAGELQPLQHSMVYNHDQAIRHVCDWVERTSLARQREPAASVGDIALM
jgi:hypothetical protein